MNIIIKKHIAYFMAVIQLLVLLPIIDIDANAEGYVEEPPRPVLNRVIEGTVRFGSFHYLGDKTNNRDGVDYVSTFYYSDDYFSPSAVNPNADGNKTKNWTDLENISLATLSKDFTIASYGSNENTFPTTNWSNKSKNAERFLADCEFNNVFISEDYNKQTNKDSLGYVFGSKQINVWDQTSKTNKTYTLIAVGVRGAGYGAEWASNLTIGDSNGNAAQNKSYSGSYRHKGFDDSAAKVMNDLETYAAQYANSGEVKYWVVGFSRAGAVANLVAGALTDRAASFHTSKNDIYGYTFEAAAGAMRTEDPDGTKYPNIHNIINKMDAVPLVSPRLFNHDRLGVDYLLPYYGNTENSTNSEYYNNMWNTLKNVAVIADPYNGKRSGDSTEDPTITDSNPAAYPYNKTIQISSFKLMNGANINNTGDFTSNVSNARSSIGQPSGLYMDQFLEKMIGKAMESRAWDADLMKITSRPFIQDLYNASDMTYEWQSHEWQYVKRYQNDLRTLAGDALKNPGMGISFLDGLADKIFGSSGLFLAALQGAPGLFVYYPMMDTSGPTTNSYYCGVVNLIDTMGAVVNSVLGDLDLYNSADLPGAKAAIKNVMAPLTWLYCEDHKKSNGEYVGTLLDNVSSILVTHVPELGVSWLMSMDDVFTCDYREITLPLDTNVKMYEFRKGFETDELSSNGMGALVAKFENGTEKTNLDDRITISINNNSTFTIAYPGNLDIRFDVQALKGNSLDDLDLNLADYKPASNTGTAEANMVNVHSECVRNSNGNITNTSIVKTLTRYTTDSAASINDISDRIEIPMSDKDVLHIMAAHGSNQVGNTYSSTYEIDKSIYVDTVIEGQLMPDGTYLPVVFDDDGEPVDLDVEYTTNIGDSQYGHSGMISLQEAESGNQVQKYFVTEATAENSERLSSDAEPYLPDDSIDGPTKEIPFGSENQATILQQKDQVFHVFYGGKNGDNTVSGIDSKIGNDATLSSGLLETQNGDYTFFIVLTAEKAVNGKNLTATIPTDHFDTSHAEVTEGELTDGMLTMDNISMDAGDRMIVAVSHMVPIVSGAAVCEARFEGLSTGSSTDIPKKNFVVSYGADTTVAENISRVASNDEVFKLNDGKLTLQYTAPVLNGSNHTQDSASNLIFDGLTSVNAFQTADRKLWNNYTAVPASSIYYDDDFADTTIVGQPGDSAYSVVNQNSVDTVNAEGQKISQNLFFKFKGSRIDVYCTTNSKSGYVQAGLVDDNGTLLKDSKGNLLAVTVKCSSEVDHTRYNVPTISFGDLDVSKTYTLRIYALAGANYKLDGIRVYNPQETDNTKFLNVRALLLNTEEMSAEDDVDGVAYYKTDGESLVNEDYVTIGPKQEVYLYSGETVAFEVNGSYEVAVGLSAPENRGDGSVIVTNGNTIKQLSITSVVDTYYDIMPNAGKVVISNQTDVMVAVTNIRLIPTNTAPVMGAPVRVTKALRSYATDFLSSAENPQDTDDLDDPEQTVDSEIAGEEEVTDIPENPNVDEEAEPSASEPSDSKPKTSITDRITTVISMIRKSINSLFRSLFRK